MRKAARIDGNQPDIVKQLRGIPGCKVRITSMVGDGFPDLVVSWQGANYLFELKDASLPPSKRKLTPPEKRFHEQWTGQVDVVESLEDALRVMGLAVERPPF